MFVRHILILLALSVYAQADNAIASYFVKQFVQKKIKHIINKLDNDTLCSHQVTLLGEAAKKQEIWALKMLDASSKMASGITDGNIFNFGSYDECLAIDQRYKRSQIRGKYCLFGLFIKNLPPEVTTLLDKNKFVKKNFLFHNGTAVPVLGSVCIPDSCSAKDLFSLYNASGFEENVPNASLEFHDRVCQTVDFNPIEEMTVWGWMGLAFFAGHAALIFLSTLYNIYIIQFDKKPLHKILLAYSLHENLKHLLTVRPHPDQIPCINGLRFISIMWVILGHRYLFGGVYPNINALYIIQDWAFKSSSSLITGATVSVDTFFFISGVLVIYIVLLAKSRGIKFNLLHYYLHRYIRLSPALIAVIIMYTTVYKYLGSGPLWPISVPLVTEPCYEHWWKSLLYFQNFLKGHHICVGQTWYLGVDTQMYMLAPLIFIPLKRWPKPTLFAMVVLTIISCYTGFYIAWTRHANARLLSGFEFFNSLYSSTIVRLHAWMIGAILGYILFKTRGTKIKINKLVVVTTWTLVLAIMMFDVFTMTLFFRAEYNQILSSLYYAVSRAIWSLGLSWIVFACVHGYGGLINRFLSCRIFIVLGRLTYSMFLIHIAVLGYILGTGRTNLYFSDMLNMHAFWGDLVFIIVAATIWTLAFESPVIAIGKILLPEEMAKKINSKPETNGNSATHF